MIDILLDEHMALMRDFYTYDLVVGESDKQQQNLLLITEPGSLKQFPNVGVGLFNFLESEDVGEMFAEIRKQFSGDGLVINSISITNKKVSINASYSNS
jgi:hypothetical protein